MPMSEKPSVMFVCVHNAGRSQMGAAWTRHLSGGAVEVRSAGSAPADSINPAVHEAMLEVGIDLAGETPKIITPEAVQASDVVVTMGCGDTCPYSPARATRTGSWRTRRGRTWRWCAASGTRSASGSRRCCATSTSPWWGLRAERTWSDRRPGLVAVHSQRPARGPIHRRLSEGDRAGPDP